MIILITISHFYEVDVYFNLNFRDNIVCWFSNFTNNLNEIKDFFVNTLHYTLHITMHLFP